MEHKMDSWFQHTKQKLIGHEMENIVNRLTAWQNIVNKCTAANVTLLFDENYKLNQFKVNINIQQINKILSFIANWKGLNSGVLKNCKDLSLKVYEHKSKNWLNGNKAKNYSQSLYPFMIQIAEHYIKTISTLLFKKEDCITLFCNVCMCSCLSELCSVQLRVSKGGRRVFLLCDNSMTMHKKNKTCLLLQKYANDHKYVGQFPLHRQDAIDYFNKRKDKHFIRLLILFQEVKLDNINQVEGLLDVIQFIKNKCTLDNGKRVMISNKVLEKINTAIKNINYAIQNNKQKQYDLIIKLMLLKYCNNDHQNDYQMKSSFEDNCRMPMNIDNQLKQENIDSKCWYESSNNNNIQYLGGIKK
eukprot:375091_1